MDASISLLFDELVEQRLSPRQARELARLLREDQAAADDFFKLLRIHLELSERAAAVRAFSVEELRAVKAVEDCFDSQMLPHRVSAIANRRQPGFQHWKAAFAIAASAFFAVMVWSLWTSSSRSHTDQDSVAGEASTEFTNGQVARVRRKIDCDWSDDRWSAGPTSAILAGQQISLNKGLLVLEFKSGAEITLNGPATLVASTETSAKLVLGELSARVPPRARGFRVETHAGDFVDLGTEFGMLVSDDGEVETHVFKGKVVAEPTASNVKAKNTLLKTGDAWLRVTNGDIQTNLPAEPERFLLPLQEEIATSHSTPPVDKNVALWFSADTLVQRDGSDGVTQWGDIAQGSNRFREDAWQVAAEERPKWIADSIGGRPALRFDGYKGLVTEPIKLSANQTSAVVFRVDGDVARDLILNRTEYQHLGVQLLNLNGPPHTVVQINDNLTLEARVHLGYIRDKVDPVDVGLARTRRPLGNGPHVMVYSFDSDGAIARLYLDGALVGEKDVPRLDATNAPRFIGAHYGRKGFGFTGDIAEVLVYEAALTVPECQEVSSWLAGKYGIASVESPSSVNITEPRN